MLAFDVIADHGESLFLNDHNRPGVVAPILDWRTVEPAAELVEAPPQRSASRASA